MGDYIRLELTGRIYDITGNIISGRGYGQAKQISYTAGSRLDAHFYRAGAVVPAVDLRQMGLVAGVGLCRHFHFWICHRQGAGSPAQSGLAG
jgi:hypothetical protein